MTEERIDNAANTIHSSAKLSITKGILRTVAAEAREEGREEGMDEPEDDPDLFYEELYW